jgi:D-amino-acid dehydrogenase
LHFTRLFNGNPSRFNRVIGILQFVNQFSPEIIIPFSSDKVIRYGYRSCSEDGLPYIGNPAKCSNLEVATGHRMVGLILGAGIGKLVSE